MRPQVIGLAAAAGTLALDQAVKHWMLFGLGLEGREPLPLTPFLDLRIAWNTGISYSLFSSDGEIGRLALLAVALVAVLLLCIWLVRARKAITGFALGLLIGGASGNAYDRFTRGAVADFFHVHLGSFSPWGVFNLADVAIVAGVGLLLYDALLARDARPGESQTTGPS
ncbi:MAG: signal peptidase II [Methylobacteriaceae bacterium]|nr:signal peptidase II [Methylobacteriaceae bacterium]